MSTFTYSSAATNCVVQWGGKGVLPRVSRTIATLGHVTFEASYIADRILVLQQMHDKSCTRRNG